MADSEDKGEEGNPGNPLPSSIASVFQSPDFISMMSKALLPSLVDGVKHSFRSPHDQSSNEQPTDDSSGPTKGNPPPSKSSGSPKGPLIPSHASGSTSGTLRSGEPPAKVPRVDQNNTNLNKPFDIDEHYPPVTDPGSEDDFIETSSQRWQASEELSALLNICLMKPLSGFDKRQIVRACPRPDVDCVYTPTLDKFLPDLVPKCKTEDKAFRKTQDLLLDVAGPLAMIYETASQAKENSAQLWLSAFSCLAMSTAIYLVNVELKYWAKLVYLQRYTSLSNESWENNGKELFGQQFEQRLKQRAETAKAISTASYMLKGKQFFPRGTPSTRPWQRGGATGYNRNVQFRGQPYRHSRPFRGRGRTAPTFTQSTPQTQWGSFHLFQVCH